MRGRLAAVLGELRRIPDIVAVAIARRDGLLIAHALPKSSNPKKIAAMSASIVGTAEMATAEMGQGILNQVLVDTSGGKILATGAGPEAILVAMVRSEANIGLILLNIERAARTIGSLLEADGATAEAVP
ncbi:MAG TPA: roadblock/LC7 domain-containing protein [Thermoplasmata archaeon]|nr:roadblock/LC7 domain-containing protein [Thermoplasmata archaeon]